MTLVIPTSPAFPTDQMMWGSEMFRFSPEMGVRREERTNLSDEQKAFGGKYKELFGYSIPMEFENGRER